MPTAPEKRKATTTAPVETRTGQPLRAETICEEAYSDPETVKTSPHNQVLHRTDYARTEDPAYWATTWRAYRRKRGASAAEEVD